MLRMVVMFERGGAGSSGERSVVVFSHRREVTRHGSYIDIHSEVLILVTVQVVVESRSRRGGRTHDDQFRLSLDSIYQEARLYRES